MAQTEHKSLKIKLHRINKQYLRGLFPHNVLSFSQIHSINLIVSDFLPENPQCLHKTKEISRTDNFSCRCWIFIFSLDGRGLQEYSVAGLWQSVCLVQIELISCPNCHLKLWFFSLFTIFFANKIHVDWLSKTRKRHFKWICKKQQFYCSIN